MLWSWFDSCWIIWAAPCCSRKVSQPSLPVFLTNWETICFTKFVLANILSLIQPLEGNYWSVWGLTREKSILEGVKHLCMSKNNAMLTLGKPDHSSDTQKPTVVLGSWCILISNLLFLPLKKLSQNKQRPDKTIKSRDILFCLSLFMELFSLQSRQALTAAQRTPGRSQCRRTPAQQQQLKTPNLLCWILLFIFSCKFCFPAILLSLSELYSRV